MSLNGLAQASKIQNYYPGAGLQCKVLEHDFGQSVLAPSIYYKSSYIYNNGTRLNIGASAYPTLTISPSNYKGTVIFGVELPLAIELYFYDIQNKYFFIGFGAAAGFHAIREFDNLGGVGPHFVLGGDVPMFRGVIGYKCSFTFYRNSLQGSIGIYYQIGYGH